MSLNKLQQQAPVQNWKPFLFANHLRPCSKTPPPISFCVRCVVHHREDDNLCFDDCCVLTRAPTVFFNNSAGSSGGGIYVENSLLSLKDVVRFLKNSATSGGALYVAKLQSPLLMSGAITFIGNTAQNGGAITLLLASAQLGCCTRFLQNQASLYGGAMFSERTSVVTVVGAAFLNNTAGRSG